MESTFEFLRFVQSKDLSFWDVKSYLGTSIRSQFVVIKLKDYLIEQNKKEKLFKYPDEYFKILGVNNQNGLFDAYEEQGKNINQPYKKVENGWFAYNPYRVNVGSIGLKSAQQNNEYISPAYVVFSCKDALLPDYLNIIIKTKFFNEAINANTTGSVRQTLGFNNLCNIEIPLPSIERQKELVAQYDALLNLAKDKENQAETMEQSIDDYLMAELGIKKEIYIDKNPLFNIIQYKQLYKTWKPVFKKELNISEISLEDACVFVKRKWSRLDRTSFDYIEINSIDKNQQILTTTHIETKKAPSRATQEVKTGDLLIATTRPYLKKFAIVSNKNNNDICSSGFQILNAKRGFDIEFIKIFLSSNEGVSRLSQKMTGALYPAINTNDLKKIQIPNYPLVKQEKIVKEITLRKEQIKGLRAEGEKLRLQALSDFEKEVFN